MTNSELLNYIKDEYTKGYSYSQIANRINVSKAFVARKVQELGIARSRSESEQVKKLWRESIADKHTDEIKKLYIENRMSMNEIANKLDISYWSVNVILNNANLARDYHESVKLCHDNHPEIKEQIRQTLTGTHRPQEVCDKIGAGHLGMVHSFTSRAQMSKSHTGVPLSPSHRLAVIKASVRASHKHPNDEEIFVGELLERLCPGRFQYNGGCELGIVIGFRVPDYIDVTNHMVVLFNGCYYHSCLQCFPNGNKFTPDSANRNDISAYINNGYKCLVIWGHELESYAEKIILEFIK